MTYSSEADFDSLAKDIETYMDEHANHRSHNFKAQKRFIREIDETAETAKLYDIDSKGIDLKAKELKEIVREWI